MSRRADDAGIGVWHSRADKKNNTGSTGPAGRVFRWHLRTKTLDFWVALVKAGASGS